MPQSFYNPNTLYTIQIALGQYPILKDRIIDSMYDQLIRDGYTTYNDFENRIMEFALLSQKREGLQNPVVQEGQAVWEHRLRRVRSFLVCSEYSLHYSVNVFQDTVDRVVQGRIEGKQSSIMWHNLQYSAVDTILEQAQLIERLPAAERKAYEPRLMGAKVVLIRRIISDQLPYINIAKNVFSINDLIEINRRIIGKGCIGGKAAGLILANRILRDSPDAEIRNSVHEAETYYIGDEEFFSFLSINNLLDWADQIYCDHDQIISNYAAIQNLFSTANFSKDILENFDRVIQDINGQPFIVRSSSMLEDGFDHAFSSLYSSIIVPNQGTHENGVLELCDAVRKIYASIFNPSAILYRARNGLLDYPERMAIIIQVLTGKRNGNYFFPDISGIGSSSSPFTWDSKEAVKKPDEGYVRMSMGLGTRVTRRTGDDFSQFILMNNPEKNRSIFSEDVSRHTQTEIDVINMKTNRVETMDIQDVITEDNPVFSWVVQTDQNGTLSFVPRGADFDQIYYNFGELIRKTSFTHLLNDMMQRLARNYKCPVLVEFAAQIDLSIPGSPSFSIEINRCRATHFSEDMRKSYSFPTISSEKVFLTSRLYIQSGFLKNIGYIIYIDPEEFHHLRKSDHPALVKEIYKLNKALADERFIFVSSFRWGTEDNSPMGISVQYDDISNAAALVEISGTRNGSISDPIAGTQFFHELIEANIYSIIAPVNDAGCFIDWNFLHDSTNIADQWYQIPESFKNCIKVFSTAGYHGSKYMNIALDRAGGLITAYFE